MFDGLQEAAQGVVLKIRDGKKKVIYQMAISSLMSTGGLALIIDGYMHNEYLFIGLGIGFMIAGLFGVYHVNQKLDEMLNDATKDAFAA